LRAQAQTKEKRILGSIKRRGEMRDEIGDV
jgi:hypothetical protein